MNKTMIKMLKLIKFTKELLSYLEWDNNLKEGGRYGPDYFFEKDNVNYTVQIRDKFDLDTIKRNYYIKQLKDLKTNGYTNIIFVYNEIKSYRIREFQECSVIFNISNILYLIRNNVFLTNKLIGILDYSVKRIKPVKPLIEILYDDKKICDSDKVKYLESIAPGRNSFSIYQTFCIDTLKYLFSDVLGLWEKQKLTNDDLNKYDLICKIKGNSGYEFFDTVESYLKSKYIVFEFKNYSKYITQREVCITEKYLYEASFRKLAIIITRKGVNEGGIKMMEGILRETDKYILVINDDDIKNMIKLKESNQDPSIILSKKLDSILTCLGK